MIRMDMPQGSPEWFAAHMGIPTASQFGRILTATGKPSSQADGYLHWLVAERLLGQNIADPGSTPWMERGTELERQAVAYYELQTDVTTETVGFCLTDDRRIGCSPDRFVGTAGGLEIKCPSAAVHVGYLLDELPLKFKPQVQGCMMVTGRKWWDLLSFNPLLPPALVRIPRDEEYIEGLSKILPVFCAKVDEATERLSALVRSGAA